MPVDLFRSCSAYKSLVGWLARSIEAQKARTLPVTILVYVSVGCVPSAGSLCACPENATSYRVYAIPGARVSAYHIGCHIEVGEASDDMTIVHLE